MHTTLEVPRRFAMNTYPTTDGKPMAETDRHRTLMFDLIDQLKRWYASDPMTYVSGNLLLFYEQGNKRRHVSPDVMVVHGIKDEERPNYLMWEEGKGPDVVFELTSKTTRSTDTTKKMLLYQNVLRVKEYFLFDPYRDYLKPDMQGYRLFAGEYRPIRLTKEGRIPSKVLGLQLERDTHDLRLWNPLSGQWIPTTDEVAQEEREGREAERREKEAALLEIVRLRELLAKRTLSTNGSNGSNGAHQ